MIKTQLEIRREAELMVKANILDKNNVDISQYEELELAYSNAIDYIVDLVRKIQNISHE